MKKITILIILLFSLGGCFGDEHIQNIKDSTLKSYPNKKLGQVIDKYVENPEWETIVGTDGKTYVNVIGKIMYVGVKSNLKIQYKIYEDGYEFNALEINGIPQGPFIYYLLLESMYER